MLKIVQWRRVVVSMLLAGVVGLTLGGCVILPVPVGGGGHGHHHGHW